MKKHWQSILNVLMAIMLISCLVQISEMKTTLNQLNNNFTHQIGIVRDSVNSISWNVSNTLEEQANLLADSTWDYGEMDLANQTATVDISITPKEYNQNTTKATVFAKDKEYPLTLQNGSFVGEVTLPLFEVTQISKVSFVEGNNVRTEELNWTFEPCNDFLPQIWVDFGYSYNHGKVADNAKEVQMNGDLNIDINGNLDEYKFKNISLFAYSGEKEVWRRDITEELEGRDNSVDVFAASSVVAEPIAGNYGNIYYHYNYVETLSVPLGETYAIYCELVGADGLVYRSLLLAIEFDENGNAVDLEYDHSNLTSIYDKDGNLLYAGQY